MAMTLANEMTWVHYPSPGSSLPTMICLRRDPNPNMDNLVLGFYHQSRSFWRNGLNGYGLWLIEFQWMGLSRGGKRWSIVACPYFVLQLYSLVDHFTIWRAAERIFVEFFGFLFDKTCRCYPCVWISLPLLFNH